MSEAAWVPLATLRPHLVVGAPLPMAVLDAAGRLLLGKGTLLGSERQLDALMERGGCVDAEDAAALLQAVAERKPAAAATRAQTLFDAWELRIWSLDALLRALAAHSTHPGPIGAFLDELLVLVERDIDVALYMCMRQDDRRFAVYPVTHSLHTAVLAMLAARQLGWPASRVRSVGQAALTMNAAMLELQGQMCEQPHAPTTRQIEQIRAHPQAGVGLLRQCGVTDPEWLAAVEEHHEAPDGSGYPAGIADPGEAAVLLRCCDVFMAKISPRAHRAAMVPQQAARQLFEQMPGSPLPSALIRAIGVYPPGSLVQLQSGEIGVVTRRAVPGRALQVATLSDARGRPEVDTRQRDGSQGSYAPRGPVTDATRFPRVLPERVYGLLAA